jgi:hypothetical protein
LATAVYTDPSAPKANDLASASTLAYCRAMMVARQREEEKVATVGFSSFYSLELEDLALPSLMMKTATSATKTTPI